MCPLQFYMFYVGKLDIIGLTTHLLSLSDFIIYFGGKQIKVPSLLVEEVV
jgi:hypothetical protein